jgi:amino acid transporter
MTTAQPAPPPAAPPGPDTQNTAAVGLRPRAVSMLGSIVIALSGLAPLYVAMTTLGIIFALVGPQTPGILWLGWIPVMGIAWSYRQLNRLRPSAGASYTWVGRSLGAGLGYLQGWVILAGSVVVIAFATMQIGTFAVELLRGMGVGSIAGMTAQGTAVLQGVLGLLALAIVVFVTIIGIGATVRMQLALTAAECLFLVGLTIAGLAFGDGPPVSAGWLNPTQAAAGPLASALVIGALVFWGWDVSANVSEEAVDAKQTGRAMLIAVIFTLFLHVLYSMAAMRIAPVADLGNVEAYQSNLIAFLVGRLAGDTWATVVTGAIIISIVSLVQVFLLQTSRTAYAMGRDGALGSRWALVHPRWRTPWAATLLVGVISAVLAVAGTLLGTVGELVAAVGIGLGVTIAYYYGVSGITCAVASWRLARQQSWRLVHLVVVPLLSGVVLLVIGAMALKDAWSAAAGGGQLGALIPLALLVAGLPLAVRWQLRRRVQPAPESTTRPN